jgi:hypothetical protein
MSLAIKIGSSSVAKKATSITLKDTTGVFDLSSNPGGYGIDNSFASPTFAYLFWRFWTDDADAFTEAFIASANTTELVFGSGYSITPTIVGSETMTDKFTDGVYQGNYVPLNSTTVQGTFVVGSKIVTLSSTDFDPASKGSTLAAYVIGITGDANSTRLFEVDWTGTNDDTQITLVEEFDGVAGSYDLWFGPLQDFKVLVNKGAEECIVNTIGKISQTDCVCTKERDLVNKFIQWRFAADVQFDCEDYDGAQNLLTQINRYCAAGACLIC